MIIFSYAFEFKCQTNRLSPLTVKCGSLPTESPSVALTGPPSPSTCHSCICPRRVPQWRPMTCTSQPPGVLSEGPDHAVGRRPVRWVGVSPEAGLLWIPWLTPTPCSHLGEKAPAWFTAGSVQNEMPPQMADLHTPTAPLRLPPMLRRSSLPSVPAALGSAEGRVCSPERTGSCQGTCRPAES